MSEPTYYKSSKINTRLSADWEKFRLYQGEGYLQFEDAQQMDDWMKKRQKELREALTKQ